MLVSGSFWCNIQQNGWEQMAVYSLFKMMKESAASRYLLEQEFATQR